MAEAIDTDIVIGGGGIAGSVAAVALSRLGFRIALIEPNLHPERRQGGEVLHPRGVECLLQLGLLAGLRNAGAVAIHGFRIQERDAGDVMLRYSAAGLGAGIALDHGRLHAVLFAAAARSRNVTVVHGKRVMGLADHGDRVEVKVAGMGAQASIRARLLIAADGSRAQIRQLAGIDSGRRRVSMISTVTIPADALPDAELGHVFAGGGGLGIAYPIGAGQARLMVDHQGSAPRSVREVTALLATSCPESFRKRVAELPEDQRVRHFPTDAGLVGKPYRGRVVLIGDAACTCHPLTASGMTSGIVDAVGLAQALRDTPDDIPRALARHTSQCRPRQASRSGLAGAMQELFAGATPECALLRRAMMRYFSSIAGGPRAIALLSMAEDRPAMLWRAITACSGYGLCELLNPSIQGSPATRCRIVLAALRRVIRYVAGSIAGPGNFSLPYRSVSP